MNWYSQLTQLIFSFYRENPSQLQQISVLRYCKLSRWWGVVRINCDTHATAHQLVEAIDLLKDPIAQLRLAHHIKIMVNGNVVTSFPVASPKLKT